MTNPTGPLCSCGRPTAGAVLCSGCQRTLAHAIVKVGLYWGDLTTVATKQTRYGSGSGARGSLGKERPMPVDHRFLTSEPATEEARERHAVVRPTLAPATQLRWDAWNTVVSWCRVVMEDQPELVGPLCDHTCPHISCSRGRRRRWPSNTVPSMLEYLSRQFALVVSEAWAPDLLDELRDLERRLLRLVDRPADRWYAGKCSALTLEGRCEAELYASVDSGTVTCPRCKAQHDVAARRDFLLTEAKEYLVTATEAAGALLAWTDYDGSETKLLDRIRKWRDRSKLEVRDVTSLAGRDRHLYRLGDIQDLLVGDAQLQQTRRLGAALRTGAVTGD